MEHSNIFNIPITAIAEKAYTGESTEKAVELSAAEEEKSVELSAEQEKALQYVCQGKNVFITGSAGVGKSFLLKEILNALKGKDVYVTASTGVAACNIGGTTLHSGIGLGDKPVHEIVYQILYKNYRAEVKNRWQLCDVLVIDEISMIDGQIFSKVEEIARKVRDDARPFGGIQVILCGDFLQLPPVNVKKFAFETQAWKAVVHETIVLKKVFRQKLLGFVALLNRMRYGQLKAIDIEVLHECSKTQFPDDGIRPTRLFPFRAACDQLNFRELSKLPGNSKLFRSDDWAKEQTFKEQLQKNCKYPNELKIGAQVMLLTNLSVSQGLVNGARGVVIGFKDKQKEIEDEIRNIFASFDDSSESEKHAYAEYLKSLSEKESRDDGFPVVKFANGIEQVIKTDQIKIEINKETVAFRLQVPLNLAWAVSIHKAQGMTLERVDINVAKAFEHGQAYVALSRVTSLKGLLLRDFDPSKITAHPKVLKYYSEITPSVNHWADIGEEELKKFIDFRRHPFKYQDEIKAEENEARKRILNNEKEKLEDAINLLEESRKTVIVTEEHNYATPTRPLHRRSFSNGPTTIPNHSRSNISLIDLTTPDKSDSDLPPVGLINTPTGLTSSGTTNTPAFNQPNSNMVCGEFDTPLSVGRSAIESSPLVSVYSSALSRAEERLARCKKLLERIKLDTTKETFQTSTPSSLDNKKTELSKDLPSNNAPTGTVNGQTCKSDNLSKTANASCSLKVEERVDESSCSERLVLGESGEVTAVIESDQEDDHRSSEIKKISSENDTPLAPPVNKPRRSLRNRKRKSYDDYVVESINKENSRRKGKTPKTECACVKDPLKYTNESKNTALLKPSTQSISSTPTHVSSNANQSKNEQLNNENTSIPNVNNISKSSASETSPIDYKKLLEEKRELIEQKRLQALAKRLNSLKRSSNIFPPINS